MEQVVDVVEESEVGVNLHDPVGYRQQHGANIDVADSL